MKHAKSEFRNVPNNMELRKVDTVLRVSWPWKTDLATNVARYVGR